MFEITVQVSKEMAIRAGKSEFGRVKFEMTDEVISQLSEEQREELLKHDYGRCDLNWETSFWQGGRFPSHNKESFLHEIASFDGIDTVKELLDERIICRDALEKEGKKEIVDWLTRCVDRINEHIEKGAEHCVSNSHGGWEKPKTIRIDDQRVDVKNFWYTTNLRNEDIKEIEEFDPECAEEARKVLEDAKRIAQERNEAAAQGELIRKANEALEKQRAEEANLMRLALFVDKHCNQSQKERFNAEVLSKEELEEQMADTFLPHFHAGLQEAPHPKDLELKVEHDYFCKNKQEDGQRPNTIWEEQDITSLTGPEWTKLKRVKEATSEKLSKLDIIPEDSSPVEFLPLEAFGYCYSCEEQSDSVRYVRATVKFAGREISRTYLLS